MALAPGVRLGSYEITGALGAGGMGEVYRARDTRLGRDVAIKIIPPLFADSPERVARFEREAQMLAALNHPHIAGIYGLEEAPSGRFLVLEFVEGLSLAQHLEAAPGGIPIEEALPIARQIVDALEAAHDRGIVHRDLKPANIMLTPEGQVKVLDFGLARAMGVEPASSVMSSPTLTLAAAQPAIVLGTAAYMSPEQAKGHAADKRSDVWAFGCVLFEMLTGKRAFDGEDVSDTLAAILRGEPDWRALPADVPDNVRTILRRCLERDRKARIPEISVVRYLMAEPQRAAAAVVAATPPARLPRNRLLAAGALGLLAGIAIAASALWAVTRRAPAGAPPPVGFAIVPSSDSQQSVTPTGGVAISPDGRHIVYAAPASAGGDAQLMVRKIDEIDAVPLPGTNGARLPFFSHDGKWIGFWAQGEIRKIPVNGGSAVRVCRAPGEPRGAAWTATGSIVFATGDPEPGLFAVPASGGEPVRLTAKPPAR